jgi:hypothetical protein
MSEVLRRNTRLFLNCLEGLPAGAGPTRASERTNSIEFVALHLLDVRFLLAAHLGLELRNPYAARLEQARGIDDIEDFPPLDEVIRHWRDVSAAVADRLEGITDE